MLNLVFDNQQHGYRKTFQADDINWQQYNNTEDLEMQRSEDITWQTAKESYISQCTRFELARETQHQQTKDGTKTKRLFKFQKNIKTWFTSGGCTPHYK